MKKALTLILLAPMIVSAQSLTNFDLRLPLTNVWIFAGAGVQLSAAGRIFSSAPGCGVTLSQQFISQWAGDSNTSYASNGTWSSTISFAWDGGTNITESFQYSDSYTNIWYHESLGTNMINGTILDFGGDGLCSAPITNFVTLDAYSLSFLSVTNGATLWSPAFTNFWERANDSITFTASGRNYATNTLSVTVLLDTHLLLVSRNSPGNGYEWTLNGYLKWDGTNLFGSTQFNPGVGGPQPTFDLVTNISAGAHTFNIMVSGETNNFSFETAAIAAARAAPGAASSVNYIAAPQTNVGTFYR